MAVATTASTRKDLQNCVKSFPIDAMGRYCLSAGMKWPVFAFQ